MALINELNEKSVLNNDDYMIIEDADSTQKIRISTLLKNMPISLKLSSANSISLVGENDIPIGNSISIQNLGGTPREIELTFDGVFVKWKYVNQDNWTNLFSITDLISSNTPVETDFYLSIGNISTLTSGENATASIEKIENNNFVLNLGIPRGETLVTGEGGEQISPQVTKVVNKNSSTIVVDLQSNFEYRYGTLDSLTINLETSQLNDENFNATVYFRSRDTLSTKFNQSTYIYFTGDDCSFGAFIPRVSSDYKIEFEYCGQRILGKVYGIPYGGVATLNTFQNGNSVVNVAKTYIDNMGNFVYGTNTILSNVSSVTDVSDNTGKFYIDCSTLVGLAYRGIKYEDSKYVNWEKTNSPRTDLYSYAIELPRTAAQQAKYCIENGWVLPKESWGNDFRNLKAGDIIFYSEMPLSTAGTWGTRFMRVGHVALCIGSVQGNIMIYDSVTSVNGLRQFNLLDTQVDKISLIARPQIGIQASNIGDFNIVEDVNETDFKGNSENFLEVGSISLSGAENVSNQIYARTKGYINTESVKGITLKMIDSNHQFERIYFYDVNKVPISSNEISTSSYEVMFPRGCKYIRFIIKNIQEMSIIPSSINYSTSYIMNDTIGVTSNFDMGFDDYPKVTGRIDNNYKLVAKLKEVLEDYETIYVYGAVGQVLSKALIKDRSSAYSWFYTSSRLEKYDKAIKTGRTIWSFDCVNLIKSILWGWNGDTTKNLGGAVYGSNGVSDVSADGCISICKNVSTTNWENMQIGEAVWTKGHIGVYVGEGKVIECSASGFKVELTACGNIGEITGLRTRFWTKHGKLPWIDYLTVNPFTYANYKMEFKGDSQKASIITYCPLENENATISEIKQSLFDLNLGKGVTKSNYTNSNQWDSLINEVAPQFGIDPAIVKMVVSAESGGNSTMSGGTNGGYGLMGLERSVLFKGYTNPYTGAVNSGRYTLNYLDGTSENIVISSETMNGNTQEGVRLQLKVGCNILRENAKTYNWNIINVLVANNMGAGALNFICSKYICEKYGWTLVNSGSLSKQSDKVQEKVKEVFNVGDLGYLNYRKWYVETGHKLLNSGPGTVNNVELYLQYYKIIDDELPYFYKDTNTKISIKDVVTQSTTKLKDDMGNELVGYPSELVCSAPKGVPLGTKVLIQNTDSEFDGKIFTVTSNHDNYNEYTIKICVSSKELADQFNLKNSIVFVGDIVNGNKIVVATGNCNIRVGNSTKYEKIGYITKGFKTIFYKEMSNGWKQIDYKGVKAYSSGLYTTVKEV